MLSSKFLLGRYDRYSQSVVSCNYKPEQITAGLLICRTNAHQWFKSYLENRTQMCSINGSLFQSCLLSRGVPQGTILGPLLFLLYTNDLPNCLSNCEPRMYADDTHLTYAGDNADNIQLHLNQDLENVHNWLRANNLILNMTKTEFMLIGSRQRLSTLTESPTFAINDFQVRKNLACQQQFQRATMVYRSLDGLAPNYLSSKFERREVAYNLRDSENKLNVPLPRTNCYKNSFSYSGAILWNSLPCNLREAESLGQFKRLIKEL